MSEADDYSLIAGRWLAEAMEKAGITQAELARRSGREHATISRIVNSKRDPIAGTLFALIEACGVEVVIEFRSKENT